MADFEGLFDARSTTSFWVQNFGFFNAFSKLGVSIAKILLTISGFVVAAIEIALRIAKLHLL